MKPDEIESNKKLYLEYFKHNRWAIDDLLESSSSLDSTKKKDKKVYEKIDFKRYESHRLFLL